MPGERRVSKEAIRLSPGLAIAGAILLCDQFTKYLVKHTIAKDASIPVLKGIFHITPVLNKGAAFGILKARTPLFVTIALAAILIIIYNLRRLKTEDAFIAAALYSMLGGILGNLIDRLRFGHVVDFLDFRVWPVFNIADCAISVGAALLVIHIFRKRPRDMNASHTL